MAWNAACECVGGVTDTFYKSEIFKEKVLMEAKDIMTSDCATCTPTTSIEEAARIMDERNCGFIPVVDSKDKRKAIGVITDRDIVCRTIARSINPVCVAVGDCMTKWVISVSSNTSVDECFRKMEEHRVRRLLVVGPSGELEGLLSIGDIALRTSPEKLSSLVKMSTCHDNTFCKDKKKACRKSANTIEEQRARY